MTDEIKYAGLDLAISITAQAFEGKYDKGGVPYIMHCLTVMDGVKHLGVEAQIAGLLHDMIEDTAWTVDKLTDAGFNPHTISIVDLLTHRKGESYDDYIHRISVSPLARAIKLADLRHNSDIHRMKGLTEKDFARNAKYHKAYAFLKGVQD